jgi:hypothetical protein
MSTGFIFSEVHSKLVPGQRAKYLKGEGENINIKPMP